MQIIGFILADSPFIPRKDMSDVTEISFPPLTMDPVMMMGSLLSYVEVSLFSV